MTTRIVGPRTWRGGRDKEGQRKYWVKHRVECDVGDGPAQILQTPGLPEPYSEWQFDSDTDDWAYCLWEATITPVNSEGRPNQFFDIEQPFSTEFPTKHCRDFQVTDPLLELPKISGHFNKYQEEAAYDRFGYPITNSALELIRGPQVEFDKNRSCVKIQQNVATALQGYLLPELMMDHVNSSPLWGRPARTIKLSSAPWELKYYGSCYSYYSRTLEFDIDLRTFDRNILDEGTKVLQGHWGTTIGTGSGDTSTEWVLDLVNGAYPDPSNPSHFMRYIDRAGNMSRVILDGHGLPAGVVTSGARPPGKKYICVKDTAAGPPLTNLNYWLPYLGDGGNWHDVIEYDPGDTVILDPDGTSWVCVSTNVGQVPGTTGSWVSLPDGVSFVGVWSASSPYIAGETVTAPTSTVPGGSGNIHVEKYDEADFTLLGIPIIY